MCRPAIPRGAQNSTTGGTSALSSFVSTQPDASASTALRRWAVVSGEIALNERADRRSGAADARSGSTTELHFEVPYIQQSSDAEVPAKPVPTAPAARRGY